MRRNQVQRLMAQRSAMESKASVIFPKMARKMMVMISRSSLPLFCESVSKKLRPMDAPSNSAAFLHASYQGET